MKLEMTPKQKEEIAQSLKRECQFLQQVAAIFDERESEALPENAKAQNKIIYDGLMKIKSHLSEELEAIMLGGVDEC